MSTYDRKNRIYKGKMLAAGEKNGTYDRKNRIYKGECPPQAKKKDTLRL